MEIPGQISAEIDTNYQQRPRCEVPAEVETSGLSQTASNAETAFSEEQPFLGVAEQLSRPRGSADLNRTIGRVIHAARLTPHTERPQPMEIHVAIGNDDPVCVFLNGKSFPGDAQ
jgi:hypothetical protein